MENELTKDRILHCLNYNQETGIFTWIISPCHSVPIGKTAGTKLARGYLHVRIDGHVILAHRLAWFLIYGYWPIYIDHINGNTGDNRITNLRESNNRKNQQNQKRHRAGKLVGAHRVRNRKGGDPGISGGKSWKSVICLNRKKIYLGVFKTAMDAHRAYIEAAKRLEERIA